MKGFTSENLRKHKNPAIRELGSEGAPKSDKGEPKELHSETLNERPAKPGARLKSSEHDEQVELFEWRDDHIEYYPHLAVLYAVPNGGRRHIGTAKKLKAEGVMAGVFDLHLPAPIGDFSGLWIEMKYMYNKLSQEQQEWASLMRWLGHRCEVCYSFEEARWVLLDYLTESGKNLRLAA